MLPNGLAHWFFVAFGFMGAVFGTEPGADVDRPAPELRAVGFLSHEVPKWSRENHCYSCHNNGDAARALYEAAAPDIASPPRRWPTRTIG